MMREGRARGLAAVVAWVELGRPHFLAGGFLLYGLGAAAARYAGARLDWRTYLWGQLAVTATQFMTHYCNDYFDLEADRANHTPTLWSGGSRVLPDGRLAPRVALVTAYLLAGLALAAIAVTVAVARSGPFALALFGLGWCGAWFYSAPPLRLHSSGWGEGAVAIITPVLTPALSCYLQAGRVTLPLALAVAPLVGLQFCMLLAINFPDAEGDAISGKRTLVVRFGPEPVARLYLVTLALAYFSLPLLVLAGLPSRVAALAVIGLPVALWQGWRMRRGAWRNPAQWGSLGLWSVALLMVTAVLEMVAFVSLV